ncbi:glycerol-3-phosphate dehydrogenase/oxidase [Melioribacter sp. OK-6-Me]|uniref:glycerol-3-phosphate dehydrogenase/oxidase n=1 Tax=unclassified Melioribacter TaxID=2627329 RepID=UPI003EDB33D0
MDREKLLNKVLHSKDQIWDVIIIGGGATGLGAAVDAASRGFKTLLIEQFDFSKGTSSRSTKLIHGGVRYLAQGDISLVFEALHERGLLMQNAPHLVKNQQFIIPVYEWWEGPFYNIGMKVYDLMAGKLGFGPAKKISKEETLRAIPNLDSEGLLGGVIYYDGQFDDSRLAINLAQTAYDNGATLLNYVKAVGFTKDKDGILDGIKLLDRETGRVFHVKGKTFINAAGIFVGEIKNMDEAEKSNSVVLSRGVHIVLDKSFLQGNSAIMIPHTSDGRVLFAVPWHDKVILGTTDTEVDKPEIEPRASEDEIDFLLSNSARYLSKDPQRSDILSVFAGLRPLAISEGKAIPTKDISRKHQITVSPSGLITITGGKWTIYRKMGEDLIDQAILVGGLEERESITKNLPIHGYLKNTNHNEPLYYYGADKFNIEEKIISQNKSLLEPIHPKLPYIKAEIIWAVKYEAARTVEDFLARRVRALLLDAKVSIEMAPVVAEMMAKELKKDNKWILNQINEYTKLARGYLPNNDE